MPKHMKRQRKSLKPREEHVARLMVQGYSAKDATNTAGYKTPVIAYTPKIKHRIADILDSQGLGLSVLAGKLKEGLDATKVVGNSNDFIEVPDYITRHKYIDTLLKLHDQYPSTKHMVELDTVEARLRRIYSR